MKIEEVVSIVRQHCERKFPKTCGRCGRQYATLTEYLRDTTPKGPPVSYDAELGDWKPREPMGTIAFANCSCGNTLAISDQGMRLVTIWRLLAWVRITAFRSGRTISQLLAEVRARVDAEALATPWDAQSGGASCSRVHS